MTPTFRPSVQTIPIQQPFLHQSTLDLTMRPEGAVGVSPHDTDKTLYLTVRVREADIHAIRNDENKLLSFKDDILRAMDTRLTVALGI
jgi:hypothetical protein